MKETHCRNVILEEAKYQVGLGSTWRGWPCKTLWKVYTFVENLACKPWFAYGFDDGNVLMCPNSFLSVLP